MKSKETAIRSPHLKKRPLFVFCAEIKDENSCPTAANVRLSTHTYIHKCVHRQTHLSCKCRIITVLSAGGKLGGLLKIAILKRFIDVMLVNGGDTLGDSELMSFTLSPKILTSCIAWDKCILFLIQSGSLDDFAGCKNCRCLNFSLYFVSRITAIRKCYGRGSLSY